MHVQEKRNRFDFWFFVLYSILPEIVTLFKHKMHRFLMPFD